jgi:hypothetical protein
MIRLYAMLAAVSVIWADGGYSVVLAEWTKAMFNWNLTIVRRSDAELVRFLNSFSDRQHVIFLELSR